ncbi:cobalamin B12-binding domain-containing protein [Streptomyces sp. NPDC015232]|uniref:cobalamin B12-binding domain-containing protein n=1 Tax=unclassified Streptomyces TaxID=2593676 RepID=UPI0036FD7B98
MQSPLSPEPSRRVLLTTGSSDAHTWNLVHLQLFLEEHGHSVLNLGPCVPERLLVDTARMTSPDLVVLSSVNGHGHQDGLRAARALREDEETRDIPMVIGGLLGISPEGAEERTAELLAAGYDAVYPDGTAPTALLARLGRLEERGATRGACTGRAAA